MHSRQQTIIWTNDNLVYWCIYTSLSMDELTHWGWDKMAAFFPDGIFKCNFLNEDVQIAIKISMKFVPKGPINNIPALVQIMAWCQIGDKWWLFQWGIFASLGLSELNISAPSIIHVFAMGVWRITFIKYRRWIRYEISKHWKSNEYWMYMRF